MSSLSEDYKQNIRRQFLKELGEYIKKRRLKKSLSMADVAEFIEVSQSTLSRYENGESDMNVSLLPLLSASCVFRWAIVFLESKHQK